MDIIGAGRVGSALARRAEARGVACSLIRRDAGWDVLSRPAGTPIFVATRNDDLDAVLEKTPAHRRDDLVFVQNGMLRDYLSQAGLGAATRGILFFAVPTRDADASPGGTSPFTGPHAGEVVAWLEQIGLPAHAVTQEAFSMVELEKLLWNTVFGLLCEVHESSVGAVVQHHASDIDALVAELVSVGAHEFGRPDDVPAMIRRMNDYSSSIFGYRGAVKEWSWRNGWFVEAARRSGTASPVHDAFLARVGREGASADASR